MEAVGAVTPSLLLWFTVRPTCQWLAALSDRPLASRDAEWLLLAIAYQESGLRHRVQIDREGRELHHLARSFWQFERIGVRGVAEVLGRRDKSWAAAKEACEALGYRPDPAEVHHAIAHNDVLACALARALLWSDPHPLPAAGRLDEAWELYIRLWRPGRPHRQRWDASCDAATVALREVDG